MKIIFKILDYLISVFMGAGTALVVSLVVNEGWSMFVAMIVGMVLGMLVMVLAVVLFVYVSTAFEIFPVGMIITMLTGMATGMVMATGKADLSCILRVAIIFSVLAQFCIDLFNIKLRGEVPVDR